MAIQRIDYDSIARAIQTQLNSDVVNLNLSMDTDKEVKQILIGNPRLLTTQAKVYPSIYIQIMGKSEEWSSLGNIAAGDSGDKYVTVRTNVYAFIMGAMGQQSSIDKLEQQIHYLAANIEYLIRNNVKLSNETSVLWTVPTETNFLDEWGDGVHVKAVTISLNIRLLLSEA